MKLQLMIKYSDEYIFTESAPLGLFGHRVATFICPSRCLSVGLSHQVHFHRICPLGRFGLVVAMSICTFEEFFWIVYMDCSRVGGVRLVDWCTRRPSHRALKTRSCSRLHPWKVHAWEVFDWWTGTFVDQLRQP